ncbi:alpha-D-ribose 1-methylphosphonate 5-triphosphate diphosphatase [Algicella marina]|uniref:alpha-D-ribose 1-methylphosphonate 5-triphosphate diphosphatase n=1 Tax=Algicella marina TaxID=2683284 RepID=UPI0024DFAB6C|nr:alpha-D-ribose 1-methylphosphonate 5-triphosphate diphosphatase [Algicella marina]
MPADLRLAGAEILAPDGFATGDIAFRDGRLCDRVHSGDRVIDATGLMILPGIVDLHGDGFERHLAPRRGVVTDFRRALRWVEAEIAACGITTSWLAQFWSWEGGMRAPAFAARVAEAVAAYEARLDLRLQLRLETHMVADGPEVEAFVNRHGIDYLVFNDHLPHTYLAEGRKPPRLAGSAAKAGTSPERYLAEMNRLHDLGDEVPAFVAALATRLRSRGLRLGSHDDTDAATRQSWSRMGLQIAEFPVTRTAAEAATAAGDPVVMGAPNIVRGGSHNRGGIAAEPLIADGLVTAIASDYHYPSTADAAFALADRGTLSLPKAWALVSSSPAATMGLADRGRIAPGLRADVVVLDTTSRRILATFAAGRPVHLTGRLAEALIG